MLPTAPVPITAPPALSPFLRPGERLLWTDRPRFRIEPGSLILAILITLITLDAIHDHSRDRPRCILTLFLLFGFAIFAAGYRRLTIYAITTDRLLIVAPFDVTTMPLAKLAAWTCVERRNGYGDLVFGRIHRVHLARSDDRIPSGLYHIPDVKAVQHLLDTAQRALFHLPPRDPSLVSSLAID
jgi:hypothetical protein